MAAVARGKEGSRTAGASAGHFTLTPRLETGILGRYSVVWQALLTCFLRRRRLAAARKQG
jgi:hypothetical protein